MHGSSVRINYNHWKDRPSLRNRNSQQAGGHPVSLAGTSFYDESKAGLESHLGNCLRHCQGAAKPGPPARHTPQHPQLKGVRDNGQREHRQL